MSGALAHTMNGTAQRSLELWHKDTTSAQRFATMVLVGPTNLRATTTQVDPMKYQACWRLTGLLEYIPDG